jgi:hypothetical protein
MERKNTHNTTKNKEQSTKYQWRIEKPLKFMGRFGYGRKI